MDCGGFAGAYEWVGMAEGCGPSAGWMVAFSWWVGWRGDSQSAAMFPGPSLVAGRARGGGRPDATTDRGEIG